MDVRRREPSRAPQAGFTLLELIVVVAVVALAMVLVLPRLGGTAATRGVDLAAARLAATLRTARAEGIRNARDETVILDLARRTYWSQSRPVASVIEPGITIEVLHDGLEWVDRARRVRFRPDGTATGAVIRLSRGPASATVTIDWLTGATTLAQGH